MRIALRGLWLNRLIYTPSGNDIANFSDEAKKHITSIHNNLAYVAKDSSMLSGPTAAKALEDAKPSLIILEARAEAKQI